MTTTFSDDQYALAYPLGIEHHWWNTARSWLIRRLVAAAQVNGSAFLEIGCGKGLEVMSLRNAGVTVSGVELARVRPLAGMETFIRTGTDALDLPLDYRQQFTGILMLDVIEHLPDPQAVLQSLEGAFPNLAVVILTVPACQNIWSNYDEFYGHQRRYSLQMLSDLADSLGWQQEATGYFFKLTYPIARLQALLGINRSTTIHPPSVNWRWLHRIIAAICRLEYYLLPRRAKGTSAFSVLRVKPAPVS